MDAFPGYTIFDPSKKVICVIQIVEDAVAGNAASESVMDKEEVETEEEGN